ncbi:MAG: adenine phosphoribosyltransferase [Alphaproteobacteria bacterium]|nr:adenine phosphoribosyltransferase [Alphaproteobacteria bacterium]
MTLLNHIDVVPNFPKEGINFYDIQSLLKKPDIWAEVVETMVQKVKAANTDIIVGIESRGFLTGLPVAHQLGLPFGMIRKKGKLPGEVIGQDYALEYGTDRIEVQKSLILPGMRVAIMDDLLATGGTMKAAGDLVNKIGGEISTAICIINLYELGGAEKLGFPFEALLDAPLDPFKDAA